MNNLERLKISQRYLSSRLFNKCFDKISNFFYIKPILSFLFLSAFFTLVLYFTIFFIIYFFDEKIFHFAKQLPFFWIFIAQVLNNLGNSNYIFVLSFLLGTFAFLAKRFSFQKKIRTVWRIIFQHSILIFSTAFFSGIIAQLLKYSIGRARPKLIETMGVFAIKGFTSEATFASLPSGHSVTIFAMTYLMSIYFPQNKIIFYFCALCISFSRSLIGSHYLSDIVAGAVLGIVCAHLTVKIFALKKIAIIEKQGRFFPVRVKTIFFFKYYLNKIERIK